MRSRLLFVFMQFIAFSAFAATTQVIEFPKEELASESVLPVFDRPEATKARLVTTAKRLELGLFGSYSLTEAFYNPMSFGLMATYHLDETSGINVLGAVYGSGISSYAGQLNPVPGTSPPENLNLQYAPAPKYLVLGSYQFTGFYGKISLTKETVMNLHLYGLAGLGMMGIGDKTVPVVNLGIGQKFYFGRSFALRFDLRGLIYSGPDPLSRSLKSETGEVSASRFDSKLIFSPLLSAGVVYLLPNF